MRKKILFVITKSNWGGAQRYVYDLATSLRDTHEVVVALGGNGKLSDLLLAQRIRVIAIPGLTRDISLRQELAAFSEILHIVRGERPDVLHLNSSKAAGLGALAGRLTGIKTIVFTAHAWAWNKKRPLLQRALIAFLHYSTVLLSHRTICVSGAVYDQMLRFPWTRSRMRVVHPGITPLPRVSREQAREQFIRDIPALASRQNTTWIATIAELHPVKGLPYAIEAMAQLARPDLTYVIIGGGEERVRLERMIGKHALESSVFLAGHIDDAATLLSAFDIFILPSLSEAFGYVVIEAGAAEIPVLATRVGGIPEVLEEGCGLLVPPQNADALRLKLEELLASRELRASLAKALEVRVLSHFTKERMVEETLGVYESVS